MRPVGRRHQFAADSAWEIVTIFRAISSGESTKSTYPLDLYGIKKIGGDDDHQGKNLRALLKDVSFEVKKGVVTVTNRATGAFIFTGPLRHLDEGTFYPENMPAGPGGTPTTCTLTYPVSGTHDNGAVNLGAAQ